MAPTNLPDESIELFLDAAPDATVIVDPAGRIAFVNVEAEALFEYSREELVGQPVESLLPERFRDRHASQAGCFVAPRRDPMGAGRELFARRKDGTEFPAQISLSPVHTEHGTFVSSAIRDITSRKAAERELIEARELAEHANRAKSAFLAAASHDLRQPLQTLTLLSSVLTRSVAADSKAAVAVANQSEALRLMAGLVNSLLDVSKLDAGVVRPDIMDCSVSNIFSRLKAEFAALAEAKGLGLVVEDCDDSVRTDPALLGQIIQNLLANAIRYTREGHVRMRARAVNEAVRIEVLDTGIGIPADELHVVFDEFHQVPRANRQPHEGLGLGLSIVRRIANLLGCTVEVTSTVGRGSCFSVSVPRAALDNRAPTRVPKPAAGKVPVGALVLVIDDDAAVAEATAMLFVSAGLEAIVSRDLREALQKVLSTGRSPSLLVCDYHLGRAETGLEAISALRRVTEPRLAAIIVSGDTSSRIVESLSGVADCHLLSKPVDVDQLLELSMRLLRERGGALDSAA